MEREELAWAAGFFDAEGHVSSRHKTAKQGSIWDGRDIVVTISQAHDPAILERFKAAVGGVGKVFEYSWTDRGTERHDYWRFTATGRENTQTIFAAIAPWLSPIKHNAFVESLARYEEGFLPEGARPGYAHPRSTEKRPMTREHKEAIGTALARAWAEGRRTSQHSQSPERRKAIADGMRLYWAKKHAESGGQ